MKPINNLSPNWDENEISLYIITTCSNIQVMRIKEVHVILIFRQVLLTSSTKNIWTTVRKYAFFYQGLNG